MSEIDSALGVKKPPAVEYCMYFFTFGTSETSCLTGIPSVFVEPATDLCLPWLGFLGFSRNPYGQYVF